MTKTMTHLGARQAAAQLKTPIPMAQLESLMVKDADAIVARGVNTGTKSLTEAIDTFDAATRGILEASDAMHAQADALSKRAKESIGRAKDMAAQMADAMNKVTKVVGPDFEKRLAQLEHLTNCLERLSALDDAGKLAPMLAALRP